MTNEYLLWTLKTTTGVLLYVLIICLVILVLVLKDYNAEKKHSREKSNKEIKAQDEHNRIGFLLRLRDERKEQA